MKFGKLNVENSQSVSRQYGIRSIPTLLIFKDGEVATQIVGMQPKRKLQEKILEII
ncbi:thioredoxin family protein [bacterium]|nr:thioredoxin family protein [bacterium]